MYQSLFSKYLTEKKHTKNVSYFVFPWIDLFNASYQISVQVGWLS